jgi:hypothetical protein
MREFIANILCCRPWSQKNLIAPRRKERKENSFFFFELGALCAFARDTVFPISFSFKIANIFG